MLIADATAFSVGADSGFFGDGRISVSRLWLCCWDQSTGMVVSGMKETAGVVVDRGPVSLRSIWLEQKGGDFFDFGVFFCGRKLFLGVRFIGGRGVRVVRHR